MLIQFSVRNFKTFKDKATLSLVASNYDKETREHDNVVEETKFGLRLLKSAVVYGANASGKSKLIEALVFMRSFVINSSKESQTGIRIAVEPFRLNTDSEEESSEFEVLFLLKNEIYRYGFEVDKSKVVSEWLFHKPKTKEIELFYRELQEIETHPRNFQKGATLVREGFVRPNALFLSVAAQFNQENATNILSWFQAFSVIFGSNEHQFKTNTISKIKDLNQKNKILELLKLADLGIQGINFKEYSFPMSKHLEELKETLRDSSPEVFSFVVTSHRKYNNDGKQTGEVSFTMSGDESKGTEKFFYLTGPIIDALENGHILVVDELDSKIHPNLVCKLVELFNSQELNPKNAQLIFNTHDTNLLSSGLFRRDQVWFTEKNKFGEARLYSLADFKAVRKVEAFEENYIRGKYGAVPFLGNFEALIHDKLLLQHEDEK